MVFQRIMKQRRRGRSWLCRSAVVDTDDVVVDACTRPSATKGISTMSKTLNKKHSSAYGSSSNNTTATGGGSNSSSSTGIEMRNGDESDSGNDSSRDQIVMDTPATKPPHRNNSTTPAWKAENFVAAPLVEDDWWEDVDDDNDIDDDDDDMDDTSSYKASIGGKRGTYSDDDDDNDEESRQQQQRLRGTIPIWNSFTNSSEAYSNSQPIHMLSGSYTSSSSSSITKLRSKDGKRQFCNRGLQIWHQTRRIWKMELQQQQQSKTKLSQASCKKQQIPIPESFRKELVQCLADRRQFELSQSIPLSCVINAYEEVWREHGCD